MLETWSAFENHSIYGLLISAPDGQWLAEMLKSVLQSFKTMIIKDKFKLVELLHVTNLKLNYLVSIDKITVHHHPLGKKLSKSLVNI